MNAIVKAKYVVFLFVFVSIFSGCQKLSSIPTANDNFIVVPPTDLLVVGAEDASILIYWQPVSAVGFSYYNIYFGTNTKRLHFILETSNNYFFIDSLSYDSTYYFQVTAVYLNDSESTPSNVVSAKPINVYPPNMPTGLNVQGHNDNSGKYVTVIWSANTEGDLGGYEIYRDTSADFQPDTLSFSNLAAIANTNAFRDTLNLDVDKNYFYRIVAFDFAHWRSLPSSAAGDQILARPLLISPEDESAINAQNDLVFTFTNVTGASGYILYISTSLSGGDIYTTALAPDQNSFTLPGSSLTPNELYFWHVGATTVDQNTPNSVSNIYSFSLTQ
ncbi:MAG TPA: hypothetical protein VLX91_16165 [Candidatus Acidoferrales bacterium]|nr:hypothetical protein [Candidatus Acidoferrales bacterium]